MPREPIRRQGHPFIQALRAFLPERDDADKDYALNHSQRLNGHAAGKHIKLSTHHIRPEKLEKILTGRHVPDMGEVAQLAEDLGLKRGTEEYRALYELGERYYETFHADRKLPSQKREAAEPKSAEFEPPPQTVGEAIKRIRKTRYYYPFGQYNVDPVITLAQKNQLPPRQARDVQPLSLSNANLVIAGYPSYESNCPVSVLGLEKIMRHFHYDEAERTLVLSLHEAVPPPTRSPRPPRPPKPPITLDQAAAFQRYRLKLGLTQEKMAKNFGYPASGISDIERGHASDLSLRNAIAKLGFETVEDFLAAETAMPETPASQAGCLPRFTPITPEHARAFRRYRYKQGLSSQEIAEKLGYKGNTFISNMENGHASEENFQQIIALLGFETPDKFLAAEAAMPETAHSRAGYLLNRRSSLAKSGKDSERGR